MAQSPVTTAKAGSRPQQEAWTRFRGGLFNPAILLTIAAMLILIVGDFFAVSLLDHALGTRPNGSVNAFLLGVLLATALWASLSVVAIATGATSWFMGSQAEKWTSRALGHLEGDWQIFHGVAFLEGRRPNTWTVDIDHIAVGPGGVLVVETKYSSNPPDLAAGRISKNVVHAVDQAEKNAGRLRALLSRDFPDVPILPVVVCWGWRFMSAKTPVRRVGSTSVVAGADVRKWSPAFSSDQLPQATIEGVSRKLENYVAGQRMLETQQA